MRTLILLMIVGLKLNLIEATDIFPLKIIKDQHVEKHYSLVSMIIVFLRSHNY